MMKPALLLAAVALMFGSAVRADRRASQDSANSQDISGFRSVPSHDLSNSAPRRAPDFAPGRAGPVPRTHNFFGGFLVHRGLTAAEVATQPTVTARRFSQPSWHGGADFFRDRHRHHLFILLN